MINDDIDQFFNYGLPRAEPYRDFFNYLRWLGIRFNELKNCQYWPYVEHETLTIPLSKGQGFRVLTEAIYNVDNIYNQILYDDFYSYVNTTTANQLIRRYFPKRAQLDSGKYLGTYIFRHAYIKNKFNEGMTPTEIAALMGEINISNITGYINSVIMY